MAANFEVDVKVECEQSFKIQHIVVSSNSLCLIALKPDLHVTSAFAFSFDLCRHVLENANVKCKHHHLLL